MNDSLTTLATKYTFRVLHIGSLIALSYKIIKDYQQATISMQNSSFFAVMGLIVAISGFANTFILKPKKMGNDRKLWVGWHHLKLLITLLLLSPAYKYLPVNIINMRFYWLLTVIIVSPAARFYREYFVKQNQYKKI